MDNFFNSLSDIEREVLVYYLTDGDGCKSYNKTTKRVLSEKLTKNKISNKQQSKSNESMAVALQSLVVDSIILSATKFN